MGGLQSTVGLVLLGVICNALEVLRASVADHETSCFTEYKFITLVIKYDRTFQCSCCAILALLKERCLARTLGRRKAKSWRHLLVSEPDYNHHCCSARPLHAPAAIIIISSSSSSSSNSSVAAVLLTTLVRLSLMLSSCSPGHISHPQVHSGAREKAAQLCQAFLVS